jgi:ribonuclease R
MNTKKNSGRQRSWQDRDPEFAAEGERYSEPIPSRTLLLEELTAAGKPLDAEALAHRLGVKKPALRQAVEKRLQAMRREGELQVDRNGRFAPAVRAELTGRVLAHRDGYGWFEPDDGSADVYLDQRQMAAVMHGDRLRIRILEDDGRGRRSGAVLQVLEHATQQLAGRFEDAGDVCFVVPEDPRFARHRLLVASADRGGASNGDLVVARLLEVPRAGVSARATVVRVLDTRRAADLAAELAIVTHGLPQAWPSDALAQARRWGGQVRAEDSAGREDLRSLPLVTIDGEDARDFDDAVYCEPKRGGWRLIVAIADVSHYVPAGGPLDLEALDRATSVYFPDRVLPMLPEALSNELCSLKPHVDRLCMVCEMTVEASGEVKRAKFYEAVMLSHARLTYTEVAAILLGNDAALRAKHAPLVPHLQSLHELYGALRQARERRGALDFDAPEVKIRMSPDGSVAGVDVHVRNDAHRLIEECMIAANIEAARFLHKKKVPTLYRVHAEPEADRVSELQRMLRALGVGVRFPERIGTRELRQVLKQIADRPDAAFIESLLIRSMAKAVYQPTNIGHFGLGLGEYAHFTSPIRRYPDLLVHRGIRHALAATRHRYEYSGGAMEHLGAQCSEKERRADEAARDVLAYLKCDYMRQHIGDEFEGVITGVVEFGLFVQLANLQVDGLVHVSTLQGDYYEYEAARCAWTGRRTRRMFQLGMRVSVRVTRVDMKERRMDFVIAGMAEAGGQRGQGGQRGHGGQRGQGARREESPQRRRGGGRRKSR